MDLGQRLLLLTSLGQLKQLRLWLPTMDYPIPPDIGLQLIKEEDGDILNLLNLDGDLYSRLTQFVEFLTETTIIDQPLISFEADFESNFIFDDKTIEFSVMLSSEGQLILTFCASPDVFNLDEKLVTEWEKRIDFFDNELQSSQF
ncbi:MAG: hypothetical protein IH840_14450 [Candidatus Heimdallarchaeota archaeon]|nr:hypothetical protein [Candidatus Heimdallarchaeota archaeon]